MLFASSLFAFFSLGIYLFFQTLCVFETPCRLSFALSKTFFTAKNFRFSSVFSKHGKVHVAGVGVGNHCCYCICSKFTCKSGKNYLIVFHLGLYISPPVFKPSLALSIKICSL